MRSSDGEPFEENCSVTKLSQSGMEYNLTRFKNVLIMIEGIKTSGPADCSGF